ncbi:unnamed protein product [Cunninghamella blakesleeana]
MSKLFRIAIDGPAASGKSTTAKLLAKKLGFRYIDSGAMFRVVTLKSIEKELNPELQPEQVGQLAASLDIQFPEMGKVSVNGIDVTQQIRQESISRVISPIASNPQVRATLANFQRQMASTVDDRYEGFLFSSSNNNNNQVDDDQQQKKRRIHGVVMDGRDIGTVILPQAELKIFLIADAKARAQRRFQELKDKNTINISFDQILKDLEARDLADTTRVIAPLKKADDAIELDNSHLSIDQQVNQIQQLVYQKLKDINF